MKTKEDEIAEFRAKNKLLTEDTLKRIEMNRALRLRAQYRRELYDWVINGKYGRMPVFRG